MATTVITKNSSTASAVPVSGDLTQGELAVNVTDKRLFTKNSGGTVVELGTNPASLALPNGTANGVAYLNGSKVVTTGSALTFNASTLAIATAANDQLTWTAGRTGYLYADSAGVAIGDTALLAGNNTYYNKTSNYIANYINGSEQMRLTSTGLGIGTSSPVSRLDVRAASAVIGNYQQIQAFSTDTAAINLGGGISLGGYYSGVAGLASFGTIVGRKENGTDGNYAGYLAFGTNAQATGVVERMRLDSSGNLGLGVTPSAWGSGYTAQQIKQGALWSTGTTIHVGSNAYYDGSNYKYMLGDFASRLQQVSGEFRFFTAPSGTAGNAITFTQAMTLDSSGNLLVGTTSVSNSCRFTVQNTNSTRTWAFGTSSTSTPFYVIDNTTGSGVQLTAGGTSWSAFSDENLKTDLAPIENAIQKVATLRAVTGRFKTDEEGVSRAFLIAQDVQAVLPEAVASTTLPGTDDETEYLSLAYTDTIPLLVAAIKEQQTIIEQLKADVAALKGA